MKFKRNQFVMKLKNLNWDDTQKLKWWQNSNTQIVTKLKHLNCDKTKKNQILKNSNGNKKSNYAKTQIVTKLKHSKCDKTKIWIKLKNSNCDKTQKLKWWEKKLKKKLKLWPNLKTHIVEKKLEVWHISIYKIS